MIQLLSLLARRSDLTHEQFMEIWVAEAPPVLVGSSRCRRYVQYRLAPDRVWPPGTPQLELALDGIEEIWIDGSPEQAENIVPEFCGRAYRNHVERYVGAMTTYVIDERRVTNRLAEEDAGQGLLKRLVPLVRKHGWTHDQFVRHWVNVHAPLLAAVDPGPRRYCQLYVNGEIPPPTGIESLDAKIDGFSESWFRDEEEMNAGGLTPPGEALNADNKIYLERSKRFFFDEVEYPCGPA